MKVVFMAAVLALALPALAEETKLGAGVMLKNATPIASLVAKPESFIGKTVRVDGVATAVCENMGCWIAIAADETKDAPTVRMKVDDGVIVFPMSAKGKKVSAEGVFEVAKAEAQKEGAAHADHKEAEQPAYHIKGTGAVIK
jgi:hypothetical protein